MTELELERLLDHRCPRCDRAAPDNRNLCDGCARAACEHAARSRAKRRALLRELGLGARWRGRIEDALRAVSGGAPINTLDLERSIA